MIQRCPECGDWCTANSRNIFKKGLDGMSDSVDKLGEYGKKVAGEFGKRVGQIIGVYSAPELGMLEAIAGYKYKFVCKCGHTWGTNDDNAIESSLYACMHKILAERFSKSDKNNEESLDQFLKEIDALLNNYEDLGCHVTKGMILSYHNKHNPYCVLRELLYFKDIETHDVFSMNVLMDRYKHMCKDYEDGFLKIPKEQRKVIVLVSDYVTIPESFKVLRMSKIPNGLKILGQISENTLYVIHPLKDNTYIPYDEYAIELFREQLYEYRYIMECLGAKTFTVRDLHIDNKETDKAERFKLGVGGEYDGKSAEVSYENDHKSKQYGKLYNELSQAIRCALSKAPYIPTNLVWYNHKYEWQQNCESRLEGRMVEIHQQVSSKSNIGLTNQNSKKIEGEFNAMMAKVNGEYESDNCLSIKEEKEHIWEIFVEFFPMTEYQEETSKRKWWKIWK